MWHDVRRHHRHSAEGLSVGIGALAGRWRFCAIDRVFNQGVIWALDAARIQIPLTFAQMLEVCLKSYAAAFSPEPPVGLFPNEETPHPWQQGTAPDNTETPMLPRSGAAQDHVAASAKGFSWFPACT